MRQRWGSAALVALGVTLGLATAPAHGAVAAPGLAKADDTGETTPDNGAGTKPADAGETKPVDRGDQATWTGKDAAAYWTPKRMAAAIAPAHGRPQPQHSVVPPEAEALAHNPGAASKLSPVARHFDGIASVGVLFSVDGNSKAHHCTASVVHSPRGNLILTAGHCNPGSRAAFVPQYTSGAATQPYGVWAIDAVYDYPNRGTTGPGADLDFAFATVLPDDQGRVVEDVTGGNTLAATPGYQNDVTVVGYPSVRNDPQDKAVRCNTRTTRLSGTRQLRMDCGGFYGGTSGSPWLADFDEGSGTGRIVGLIGGLNGGGPKGPHSDRTSYSPYFGPEILALYNRATQDS
ncbi:trypsin-like serine peptidase [Streptomyces natalensis]|uniref:Peptidase S1 domain-containing protein n=1 Tax=Streptomyces natalensis ATCC 27448 TaxID=1240678 RepID=A0A0D7CRF2_9ACTN|nr:hypothetical protein [Streptomyces natalensis]KIZ18440.1 hypothetical protein SNA_07415 [Streptomyces natalensis ATCC 27448]